MIDPRLYFPEPEWHKQPKAKCKLSMNRSARERGYDRQGLASGCVVLTMRLRQRTAVITSPSFDRKERTRASEQVRSRP